MNFATGLPQSPPERGMAAPKHRHGVPIAGISSFVHVTIADTYGKK
jgi:hypothetical protein